MDIRISAVDMFVNSMLCYGSRLTAKATGRKALIDAENTSH
jgi:hypothetical protein